MKRILLCCLALLVAACGGPGGSDAASPAADEPPEDVIGAPLHQSLDKARSVEGLEAQRKGDLDAAVDEAN